MRAKLLQALLLATVALISTLLFIALTFPDAALKHLVLRSVEKALDHSYRVEAGEMRFGFMSGIEFKQVRMIPRFGADDEDDLPAMKGEGARSDTGDHYCPVTVEPIPFFIDRMAMDLSWLALARGDMDVDFEIEAADGTIKGALGKEEGVQKLETKVDGVRLQRFTLLRNKMGLHAEGRLSGQVSLTFGDQMSLSSGKMTIVASDVVLCPKRFKVSMPNVPFFELPLTRLGDIAGEVVITPQRRLEFTRFTGEGPDMSFTVEGFIQLASPNFPKTRYEVRISLRPDPAWVQEHAMDILYKMCRRFDDGSVQFLITGQAGEVRRDCVRASGANVHSNAAPVAAPPRLAAMAPAEVQPILPAASQVMAQQGEEKPWPEEVAFEPARSEGQRRAAEKGVGRMGSGRGIDRGIRPADPAALRGRVDPVPESRRRRVLDVYGKDE